MCDARIALRASTSSSLLARLGLDWLRLAWISACFGHRWRDSARLGLLHARTAISQAPPIALLSTVTARLASVGHEVVIAGAGELSVLRHVMLLGEYEPRVEPRVVFDLGADAGFATLYFSRRYPNARIVAVEADPLTYERLVRNVASLRARADRRLHYDLAPETEVSVRAIPKDFELEFEPLPEPQRGLLRARGVAGERLAFG